MRIDLLLIVSDHSVKGVRTIARIVNLITELKLAVGRQSVVINLVSNSLEPAVRQELDKLGLEPAAVIPWDEQLHDYDLKLKSLLDLPDTSRAVVAVDQLMTKLLK